MVEVCRGLDYAHKRGVIHRDVKPANVRLLANGSVKLVDFGIARLGESTLTQTGILLGTPSYLAPEVVAGGRVDHRADMWAVGVILYELLAGQRPFQAPTFVGLVYKIVHEPVPPLETVAPDLPKGLTDIVARTLEKDPARRYQDLAELAAALQGARGVKDGTQPTLSPQARERAVDLEIAQVHRLMGANDLERALEAARRAQALAPSRTEVVALIEKIEMYLSDAPPAPRPETMPAIEATVLATPTPSKPRLPTPVLTELRARGASVFRELATFGEPPATQAVARSPVDDLLATAGADGAIRLWDLQSRTRRQSLRTDMHRRAGHDARALALAFSPDGSLLASGHVDGSIHLWDMAIGEEVRVRLRHEQEMVSALAFSPDGRTLATGGVDSTLKLWDVPAARKGEARRELVRQPAAVTALAFAAEGRLLVTGHANRVLRVHGRRDPPADGDAARAGGAGQPALRVSRRTAAGRGQPRPHGPRVRHRDAGADRAVDAAQEARLVPVLLRGRQPPGQRRPREHGPPVGHFVRRAPGLAVGPQRRQLRGHHAVRRRRPHRGRAGGRAHPRLGPGGLDGHSSAASDPGTEASSRRTRGPGSPRLPHERARAPGPPATRTRSAGRSGSSPARASR